MLSIIQLDRLLGSWAHLYADSKAVSSGVTFLHLGGVLLGGGFAIAADRMTIRYSRNPTPVGERHLSELHAIHRPVMLGLLATLLSGLLMFTADVSVYLPAPLFWGKMAVIALLLVNGARLRATETRIRQGLLSGTAGWVRLRRSAQLSAFLWFGALLLGTALLSL